jgi:hypothetical protein
MPYMEDSEAKYRSSKPIAKGGKVRGEKRIQWAWDTICERARTPAAIGFYPKTERGESKWAAFDVDAHDGDQERARSIAAKLFAVARQDVQLLVVLASSGNGGWHLFLFTTEFRPCDQWTRLLRQIADMAGVEVKKGYVEFSRMIRAAKSAMGFAHAAHGIQKPVAAV